MRGRTASCIAAVLAVGSAACAFTPHRAHHPEMFVSATPPEGQAQPQPQLGFAGAGAAMAAAPAQSKATRSRHVESDGITFAGDPQSTPAYRYASLDRTACEAELTRRGVPFVSVNDALGVLAPVRLTGPVRGIAFHSGLPESVRATSPIEIFDCRLVLALDDFATILAAHDVVEVIHMSVSRRAGPMRAPAR